MTAPPPASPGWYPDPSGSPQRRYWDGSTWTENVAPYDAPPTTGAAPVATSSMSKGCIWALVIGAVLLLVIPILAVVALRFLGDSTEDILSDVSSDIESDSGFDPEP